MKMQRMLEVAVVLLFLEGLGFGQMQGRVERYTFTWTDEGVSLGSCPGGFDIYWDAVTRLHGFVRFDKNGNPLQEVDQFKIIGQTIYYNSTDPNKFVLGGPGEAAEIKVVLIDGIPALEFINGLNFKVVLRGYGPIFFDTGHTIIDYQIGEVLFASGHNQLWDADLAALCNALK